MRALVIAGLLLTVFAFAGCKGDPTKPDYWENAIKDAKGPKGKTKVVESLRASKNMGPAMLPMLRKHLEAEKSGAVKGAVARLLGEQKDKEAVAPLMAALDWSASDRDEKEANVEIARALRNIGDARAVPTMLKLMNSRDNFAVIEGIEGAGALKAKDAVDQLIGIATKDDTENFITKKAIVALGDIGDPKAVPLLVKLMFKERRGVSFYMEASFALYQLGAPANDAMLVVLEGKDKDLAEWAEKNGIKPVALPLKAAQVLGDAHDKRAEPTLVKMLTYKSEFMDLQLLMRMRAADALGRMRSKDGARVLAGMLDEEEANARHEYIWGLMRIGGHDAAPKLVESAGKGSWDAREEAMIGVAMVGDERELAAFDKMATSEQKLMETECKDNGDYPPCKDLKGTVGKHVERINDLKKSAEAAKECKAATECWVKKLDDKNRGVRQRAAYELGRSEQAKVAPELLKRVTEKDLDARLAFIQGADWIVHDSKEAHAAAKASIPAIEKQLADEKGKTEFIKVNEDLRRLLAKIEQG